MKSTRKQCLRTLQRLAHAVTRKAANSESEEWLEIKRDIETMRRIFVSMADEVFQTQLKFYDEEYGSVSMLQRKPPPLALLLFTFICGMAAAVTAQPNLRTNPVSSQLVTDFMNARCGFTYSDSTKIDKFPASYRTDLVAKIYTPSDGAIPYEIYYAESTASQLYLIARGLCRNISTLVPIPCPGWYFVRYWNQAKPALVQINARNRTLKITAKGPCEIHD